VDGEPLDTLLAQHPKAVLGERVLARCGPRLPFLLKVLSIGAPLSIQAHPDQALARQLHARAPELYPDDQHKPEIAIAISAVQALYGFLPAEAIAQQLQSVPELMALTSASSRALLASQDSLRGVQAMYREVVSLSKEEALRVTQQRVARIQSLPPGKRSAADRWVAGLAPSFPEGDVGLLCFYLLRLIEIPPGKALFTAPNVPHAYLTGELVECMATSDNVVRGGLTKKPCDFETLVSMLSYQSPGAPLLEAAPSDSLGFERFCAPVEEFSIARCQTAIRRGTLFTKGDPLLIFCLEGDGSIFSGGIATPFQAGSCFLVPAALPEVQLSFGGGALFLVSVPE